MVETVFNRFFDGEEVLLSELQEAVGDDNKAILTLVVNCGYVCGCVSKIYAVGGQRRALTGRGLSFYNLVKSLFIAGEGV